MSFATLALFFSILYLQGILRLHHVPKIVIEGFLYSLPAVVIVGGGRYGLQRPAPGLAIVVLYVLWSVGACVYHGEGIARGLLFPRYLVLGYMVLWAIQRARLTGPQAFGLTLVIFAFFLLQVPAALWEIFVRGEITERIVGTLGEQTGAIATVFPLYAFIFSLAFYFYLKNPLFLALGAAFFIVGFGSGKLGVFCLAPVVGAVVILLFVAREGMQCLWRRSFFLFMFIGILIPFFLFLLSHQRRTTDIDLEQGMRDKLSRAVSSLGRIGIGSEKWYTTSRPRTSLRVVEETFKRPPAVFLFGQGPSVLKEMSGEADGGAYDEYGIIYGVTGWSEDAIGIGWPGMFLHAAFYGYLLYCYSRHMRNVRMTAYWNAVVLATLGGFWLFFIIYLSYSPTYTTGGWIISVQMAFMGMLTANRDRRFVLPLAASARARYCPPLWRHSP